MIRRMTEAKTEAQLLPACHALERIITHGHYLIPQWSAGTHRMVYDSWRLVRPAVVPAYAKGESWAMDTWWARMPVLDRKSTRLNSSHLVISYAVFCLKKKNITHGSNHLVTNQFASLQSLFDKEMVKVKHSLDLCFGSIDLQKGGTTTVLLTHDSKNII